MKLTTRRQGVKDMKKFLSIAALLTVALLAYGSVSPNANAQDISGAQELKPIGLYTFFNTGQTQASKTGEPKLSPVITALDVLTNPATGQTIFFAGGDAPNIYFRDVKNVETLDKGVAKGGKYGGKYEVVRTDAKTQVNDWIRAISVNPVTREVATLSQRGQIVIWNTNTWKAIKTFDAQSLGGAHAMKYSPNGKILAVCGYDNSIRFYGYNGKGDAFDGSMFQEIDSWLTPSFSCTTLDFYSDRDPATGRCVSTLLAAGGRQTACVWDVVNGAELGEFPLVNKAGGAARRVRAVAFSPDGKRLAVAGDADQIMIWDIATSQVAATVELSNRVVGEAGGVSRRIFSMTFTDADTLATGDSVNDVILWNLATGKAKSVGKGLGRNDSKSDITAHSGTVAALVYVENANDTTAPRSLLSGGFDTLVIRWELP